MIFGIHVCMYVYTTLLLLFLFIFRYLYTHIYHFVPRKSDLFTLVHRRELHACERNNFYDCQNVRRPGWWMNVRRGGIAALVAARRDEMFNATFRTQASRARRQSLQSGTARSRLERSGFDFLRFERSRFLLTMGNERCLNKVYMFFYCNELISIENKNVYNY